jgi:RNA polymerase sigma factor (sigma-70 family)
VAHDETSFRALIQRVRQGNEEAAAQLHQIYGPQIQRIIRVRLTNRGLRRQLDSLDICQSVFANFFVRMALGQYDISDAAELMKLLSRMARNRLLHHAERHTAARRDMRRVEDVSVENLTLPAPDETPSQIASARELVERFVARLSPAERRLVEYRRAGKTWREISLAVGRTADAARKQYERAVARVSRELDLEPLADG